MLKKIRIEESGDSDVLPGVSMDVLDFNEMNEALIAEGKRPAEGKQVMLGITKASLATDSFLSCRCDLIIRIQLYSSVALHTGTCRDWLTDNNILLQTNQVIYLTVDSGLGQNLGGLLEGCS